MPGLSVIAGLALILVDLTIMTHTDCRNADCRNADYHNPGVSHA
jgi:hypothetical protein